MVNKMVKVNGKDIWRIKLLKKLKKFTRKETIKKMISSQMIFAKYSQRYVNNV